MESSQFNKWYRNGFEQMKEEPPQEVWDNISNELDLQEVWSNVKNDLQIIEAKQQTARLLSYTISFVFLVLLSMVGLEWFFAPVTEDRRQKTEEVREKTVFGLSSSVSQSQMTEDERQRTEEVRVKTVLHHPVTEDQRRASETRLPSSNSQSPIFPVLSIATTDLLTASNSELTTLNTLPQTVEFEMNPSLHESFSDRFYLGGTYKITNSWLLNDDTYNGLAESGLTQTLSHLGKSAGITLEYCFSKDWSGQIDWFINSQSGQTYKYYEEGKYIKKDIVLNYQLINLIIKHSLGGTMLSKNISTSQNLLTGVNFKSLESEKVKINDVEVTQPQHYTNADYGFMVGYEYSFLINKKVLISSAITGDFGLKNIFKGSDKVPANFNSTYNTSVNAVFGIKYLLQ